MRVSRGSGRAQGLQSFGSFRLHPKLTAPTSGWELGVFGHGNGGRECLPRNPQATLKPELTQCLKVWYFHVLLLRLAPQAL